jgi:hypothetical protein
MHAVRLVHSTIGQFETSEGGFAVMMMTELRAARQIVLRTGDRSLLSGTGETPPPCTRDWVWLRGSSVPRERTSRRQSFTHTIPRQRMATDR